MKRFFVCVLIFALCLTGCRKARTDLPGGEEVPERIDWKLWEQYTPVTLNMGEETVSVLMSMDAIHLAIYYDQEEQELMGSLTIPDPLSDPEYSLERMRIEDKNQDGYDDICIPDMLQSGDRIINWWLWDSMAEEYRYAPEYSENQQQISADASWKTEKNYCPGSMDTPKGLQSLLVLVEGQEISVYLDTREERLWGTAHIPEPLTLPTPTYWSCRDLNGDGWGDLQLPYRWETAEDGSVYQYSYCWHWDNSERAYVYDAQSSEKPVI
jgi:hypothetical protein